MTARSPQSLVRAVAMVLGAAVIWWRTHTPWAVGLLLITSALLGLALVYPPGYRPIERGLDAVQHATIKAVSWLLLGLVFLTVFIPGRVIAILCGRQRRFRFRSEKRTTYWMTPARRSSPESFGKQY